ncbi:beta family protein [Shinella yambaruensis]|nr:beta family protein [Shinella yambaruensis]MCJ8028718.1 beta family protein [Shinella yambaruensis]MCU7983967.1 beta family protein [Shinella yambaruensis]
MPQYTPILRWKRGERVGLQHLTAGAKQRSLPLFLLGADQYKLRPATARRDAVPAPDAFIQEVRIAWGTTPFLLDASALPSQGLHHPLQAISAACAGAGLAMIPTTALAVSPAYQAAVNASVATGNGVCLRIDLQEASSMQTWIGAWPHPLEQTDLILDFGAEIGTVAQLGPALDDVFLNLHAGNRWRSVSMAGTSMPENFTGYLAGQHLINRREWSLWQHLHGLRLPYRLDYADFTSTSPGAPPPNIAWGYPINVKYTLPDSFLICRGVRTTGPQGVEADVQLVNHANSIRNFAQRHALAHIWADSKIDDIAVGNASPQGLEHWVQLGVNRHIELMATLLP